MAMEVNRPGLRTEEMVGLGLAVFAHIALMAVLLIQATDDVDTIEPPERIAVSLVDGLDQVSQSPTTIDETLAPGAPVQSDVADFAPPPPRPNPAIVEPETSAVAPPTRPTSRPTNRPTSKPKASAPPKKTSPPKKKSSSTTSNNTSSSTGKKTGGSSKETSKDSGFDGAFGGNFGDTATAKKNIKVSIGNQVTPHWNRCRISGLDIDKLRAKVTFRMDSSGRITNFGRAVVSGQTPSNKNKADLFGECAIKALRRVKQFAGLPAERHDLFASYTFTFRTN